MALGPTEPKQVANFTLRIATVELVTVTSRLDQVDLYSPDPSEKVFVQQNLIDAKSRPSWSPCFDPRISN